MLNRLERRTAEAAKDEPVRGVAGRVLLAHELGGLRAGLEHNAEGAA